jgi:beta-glucanase (GH16 family)
MTRYLYGDKILNNGYVLTDDKHAFTDGKNVEFLDNRLKIVTRREKAKSLVWNPVLGFYEKEFEFTSDLISSAKGYTGQYGIYEAKVRVGNSGVTQAFSLMCDQILPHIDIFRLEKGKLSAGNFWNGSTPGKSISSTGGGKFTKDFFIYSLEWQPGKLTWRINGLVFKEQKTGIPDKGMYMIFNSSLKEKAREDGIPSTLEIDWIRVYKKKV